MESSVHIVVHGRGNAWPVLLGEHHPFYDRTNTVDLSNAAFSLISSGTGERISDLLIDAGHGTIQSLISGSNRIPDAICLTHGHMDHTLSVDWVVQSYWKKYHKKRRYPVYATLPVYNFLVQSYPQLGDLIEHRSLIPGRNMQLGADPRINLTSYPVFHGKSAVGAAMLLFTIRHKRILFTGDILSPLLRSHDYEILQNIDMLVVDSNNRFPYPEANHWSFAGDPADPMKRSDRLVSFIEKLGTDEMLEPQRRQVSDKASEPFFSTIEQEYDPMVQPFTLLEFIRIIRPGTVVLVHYSGSEDEKYYGAPIFPEEELLRWVSRTAQTAEIEAQFIIPSPGQTIRV